MKAVKKHSEVFCFWILTFKRILLYKVFCPEIRMAFYILKYIFMSNYFYQVNNIHMFYVYTSVTIAPTLTRESELLYTIVIFMH